MWAIVGFGPAYGITGTCTGFYFGEDSRYETMDMCTAVKSQQLLLSAFDDRQMGGLLLIEYHRKPM